ncbi:histidine kinase [Secundilactobacillus paracollinoides]|uniref:Histidine kinase n=1 Tax=Secundilactobacillus paracollinoides TaxID=240427 RepID=A0A1B2J002_9LACO|nr:GAF domain-containing protein [Secundilactobacillus paracollinoides]ANZ61705.1 histidine kinase [Secundilactobacillus paracollinoides]ANZ63340.1 histidine kinase [Secundilactobacillus paracollinoides]ANZ67623.1 histidine kinase [Secundilactobacillus paracollinoides]KRL75977.1 GAF domain-containing protein [Secundilactobacillus paracollinoides DSM 15502 = JCM 11969]
MQEATPSLMNQQIDALLYNEHNLISNLSNASALLNQSLEDINWAGFYLYQEDTDELMLGPFQGNVACVHIQVGNGVCGTAFKEEKTLVVENVHEFPGHIACDSASNSEIVVPLIKDGKKLGVMDIDSPKLARFNDDDKAELEQFADILLSHIDIA